MPSIMLQQQACYTIKLEALGQCIPPPRHVLSVSQYGLIANKI